MLTLRSIAVELTPRCNQQCVYCYNAWPRGSPEAQSELSTAEIRELLDRVLAEAELRRVTLTGGEPLLREDILDIIDYLNGRGIPVSIISNGGRMDRSLAESLAARNVTFIQVTLAGPDAQRHDALCGRGSFERTVGAVRLLRGAGVAVAGSFLCTHQNHDVAAATLRRMVELDVRHHFALNRFNPSGRAAGHYQELLPTRSEVLSALQAADRFAEDHGLTVHCTMPVPRCMLDEADYPRIRFGQCSAGTDRAEYAVDPQGRLKLCTLQKHPIGSLFETGLQELLADGAVARFRAMIPEFCRPCPHHAGCLGGCGAAAQWVFGRADRLDPFLAQHVDESSLETASAEKRSEKQGETRAFLVRIDPWYDLVYHVLSHLRVNEADASSLFDERYVKWCDQRLADLGPGNADGPRTLTADAAQLAALYDRSGQGFLLHGWPLLWDDLASFLDDAGKDFQELARQDERRKRLAAAIPTHLEPELPDLFCRALRDELATGYERVWREVVVPRAQAYRQTFLDQLSLLAEDLPGLYDVQWVLSHPLRTHGRLLHTEKDVPSQRPIIVVGVADPELGVSESHPVMQGCHEYFVCAVQSRLAGTRRWATVPGREGHEHFHAAENAALAAGARFFAASRFQKQHQAWLAHVFSGASPEETAYHPGPH